MIIFHVRKKKEVLKSLLSFKTKEEEGFEKQYKNISDVANSRGNICSFAYFNFR